MESLLGLVRHSGNSALFQAVEMSILSTLAGLPLHLHTEGLRGTGKTTVLRGARRLLPRIQRIKDCPYNCDPAAPHCPQHRGLDAEALAALGTEWVPMPFLEISHSAKVGTVVGSIDLGRLVNPEKPAAALLPGTLPRAHRGIIFVDEINRLTETAPELADVLLDVMGTKPGRVQIEETGLPSVELAASISVWAASNPDEDPGPLEEIRRQLSDRFDFVVPTSRPGEADVVTEILERFEGNLALQSASAAAQAARIEAFRARMAARRTRLSRVEVPDWLRRQVADLYARFGVESLRGAQALLWGLRLSAGLSDRPDVSADDLLAVAPLALHHRVDGETLAQILQHLRSLAAPPAQSAAAAMGGSGSANGNPGGNRSAGGAAAGLQPVAPPQEKHARVDRPARPQGVQPARPQGEQPAHGRRPAPPPPPTGHPAARAVEQRTGSLRPRPGAQRNGSGDAGRHLQPGPQGGAPGQGQSEPTPSRPLWDRVLNAFRKTASGGPNGPQQPGNRPERTTGSPGAATGAGTTPRGAGANPEGRRPGKGTAQEAGGQPSGGAPAETPPAPPHPARPLTALDPSVLVRTEADLREGAGT